MDRKTYALLERYMCSCAGDSAHDREHVYRVLSNALQIAADIPETQLDILMAACLLHDVGRPAQLADPKLCHAQVGSAMAYDFLTEQGFGEEFACHVRDCIRTHRFRKSDPPQSLEAKILFDADKLDVVGAIGIARTLAYQGAIAAPMYSRRADGTVSDGQGDTVPSFFREYQFKLKNLYDRFYTQKGAQLAQGRKAAAQAFYEATLEEVTTTFSQGAALLEQVLEP